MSAAGEQHALSIGAGVFFPGAGDGTEGLVHAGQALITELHLQVFVVVVVVLLTFK
jgi:hypothetical protein